jgi:putative sterol carrier protein
LISTESIFEQMPSRYIKGRATGPSTFYFSIDNHKYTVRISPEECKVEKGKTQDRTDFVLKTTAALFEKMVIKGKMPSPLDVMRGKIKTNDPLALKKLRGMFDFSGL